MKLRDLFPRFELMDEDEKDSFIGSLRARRLGDMEKVVAYARKKSTKSTTSKVKKVTPVIKSNTLSKAEMDLMKKLGMSITDLNKIRR